MPVCISELYPPNNFTTTPLLSPYDGFAYTNNTVIDDVLFVVFQIDCDNVLVNITCTVNDSSTGSVTVNIGETSSVTLVNSDTPLNINFLLNTGDTVSISFLSGNYTADDIFGEVKILVDGPTPTPTASVTLSPTPTASATLTPTPTPTATPLPTFACSNSLLFLWGDNQYGQLGDNTTIHRSSPVQTIFGGSNWCKHSSGGKHSVGFKNDNSLWSWGRNNQGQLGLNDVINRSSPVQIASALWIDVSAGYDFTSVLKNDGTLWSWGNNTSYQLGDGTLISKSSMVQAIHDADFVSISCGFDHGGAIDVTGRLFCWGSNEFGQCGQNQNTNDVQSPTQTVAGGNQWEKVSCGKYFTLGLKTDHTIWGWGKNTDGQFGNYSVVSVSSPIQVSNILWKNLTAGTDFGAAICYGFPPTPTPTLTPTPTPTKTPKPVVPGKLYEWGDNEFGQLGDNTTISRSAIKEVAGDGSTWTAIDAGGEQIIGLKTDGTIHLWGHNDQGQLGNNNTINKSSPLLLNSDTTYWTSVSMGSKFGSAIGIPRPSPTVTPGPTPSPTPIPGYRLYGWGDNSSGLMGNNSVVTSITPIAVGVENTWTNITGKYRTAGGIKTDGSLWLWGFNSQGQLGNNSTVHRSSPVQTISAGTDWEAVSIGYSHTLAIKKDGSLWSWGFGLYGELGIGTSFTSIVSSPVQVANMNSYVTKVAAGDSISFAIKQGKMFAWGFNGYGRLGTGSTELIITSPVQTADNSSNWVDVACGDTSVLGIKSDGTLWSWGLNLYGCLGLNDVLHRSSPVQIGTDNSWSKISMSTHAAGIKNDGTLWLWGDNRFGQIGDSTYDNRSSPVQTTTGGTNWQSVSLALPYSTAIKKDGTYWVWGPGTQYTLGTGGTNSASYPIQTYLNDNNWVQSSATLYGVAFGLRTI